MSLRANTHATTPEQVWSAKASSALRKAGFNWQGLTEDDSPFKPEPGLWLNPQTRPSKAHYPYVVSIIVSREATVSPFSRFDHYGVLYPVSNVWARSPGEALRLDGANARHYRAQLAPEAYDLLAKEREAGLRKTAEARQQGAAAARAKVRKRL